MNLGEFKAWFFPKGFYGIPPLPGVLWVGSQGRQFDHRFKSRGDVGGRSKPLGTPVGSQLFHGTMVVNNPLIRPYFLGDRGIGGVGPLDSHDCC